MKKIVIISLFWIILCGLMRGLFDNRIAYEINEFKTFHEKIQKLTSAQTLILGDSRVLNGVNPQYFGPSTLNFGFTSNSYTQEYLNYIKLKKSKELKKVLIGISVQSLTDFQMSSKFMEIISNDQNLLKLYFKKIFLNPINIWNINQIFKKHFLKKPYAGYVSLGDKSINHEASETYKETYMAEKFNEKYINFILNFAQALEQDNIDVYFFLTPSLANKYDFNKELSGISLDELKAFFENKNYHTLEYVEANLKFVDGDHLTKESSDYFSKWLAKQINQGDQRARFP